MNLGYEEEELIPFTETFMDISDQRRIDVLVEMGFHRSDVEESLRRHKYDDAYATYLLLENKQDVINYSFFLIT